MSTTVSKKSLLQQVADLQKAVTGMDEPKMLQVFQEHLVPMSYLYSRRGAADLHMVDDIRHHMKRSMVNQLADELIRTGAVKFTETLEEDRMRFGHSVRMKAELLVC